MKGRKLSGKFIKRALSVVICAGLLATIFGKSYVSEAIFDPDKAITYATFAAGHDVEDSLLFIGTYLVHKDALTDQIYEKAIESAAESGQEDIYYKSELSDGQWFETGDIDNGIRGISIEGRPESIETINPLYVTDYIGADGILRDPKSMLPKNPFDDPDPYDLSGLPELEPIRMQYTMSQSDTSITQEDFLEQKGSKESGNIRSDVYEYQLLSTFFSLNLRDAQTDKCDKQLADLNVAYIQLKNDGREEEAELVYGLMEKVDATRRALVMERLSELDENLLSTLYNLSSGNYYTSSGNFKDSSSEQNRSSQADYTIELEDSLKHNFSSTNSAIPFINDFFKRMGVTSNSSGWWTVLEDYEKEKRKENEENNKDNDDYVADLSPYEYPFKVNSALLEAIGTSMGNCGDSYTTHMSKALVDSNDILGHVIYEYSTQVIEQTSGGVVGGPIDLLKHATFIQEDEINDKEGELNYLLTTLLDMGSNKYESSATSGANTEYLSLVSEGARKSSLEDQKTDEEVDRSTLQFLIEAMRKRSAAADALEYVYQRITWTENLLNRIPSDDYKTYSTSSVQAHLVWLKEEAQKIIDSDASLKSKYSQLQEKKEELQKKRDQCLDNNDLAGAAAYDAKIAAVDQDLAREAANGKGGPNMADQLVDKALSSLADDANADLAGIAEALSELGEDEALDALKDKAEASGASADTLAGIDDAKNGDGSGNGVDSDALLDQLLGLFGKSLDEMDEDELAVACATCSRLSRMGIEPANSLVKMFANKMQETNNKFLYRQYAQDMSTEYIAMDALSKCTSFRYFYDDAKQTASMTKGATIYIFKRGSNQMYKQSTDNEPETMEQEIVYSGVVYIGENDANVYFKCIAEYCYGMDVSVCLTAPKQTKTDEFVKTLQEFFNENQ